MLSEYPPRCPFDPNKECHCSLSPYTEVLNNKQGLSIFQHLLDIFQKTQERPEGERYLTEDEIEQHLEDSSGPLRKHINASEAIKFFKKMGQNPRQCPYFSEDISPPGQG